MAVDPRDQSSDRHLTSEELIAEIKNEEEANGI